MGRQGGGGDPRVCRDPHMHGSTAKTGQKSQQKKVKTAPT
jgi:hypothetical protein